VPGATETPTVVAFVAVWLLCGRDLRMVLRGLAAAGVSDRKDLPRKARATDRAQFLKNCGLAQVGPRSCCTVTSLTFLWVCLFLGLVCVVSCGMGWWRGEWGRVPGGCGPWGLRAGMCLMWLVRWGGGGGGLDF
jgi:hypothetical protein